MLTNSPRVGNLTGIRDWKLEAIHLPGFELAFFLNFIRIAHGDVGNVKKESDEE
jgi:hypothetical protein